MFKRRSSATAFTRTDLLVVLALCPLLLTVAVAAQQKVGERARRVQCAKNLELIGKCMIFWSNENREVYPQGKYDEKSAEKVNAFTNWQSDDPLGEKGPEANDVTAALYLLMRSEDIPIPSSTFVCPSTDAVPLRFGGGPIDGKDGPAVQGPRDISNFPSSKHLSYSYANPYIGPEAKKKKMKLSHKLGAAYATAADANPGGEVVTKVTAKEMPAADAKEPKFTARIKQANSPNHGGFGQNVLYADGHVEWRHTPFCGALRDGVADNIYTRQLLPDAPIGKDPIMGPAMDPSDSVLLPPIRPAAAPAAPADAAIAEAAEPDPTADEKEGL
jgi:prepilin-type processing-associated H-X9-DG protein